MKNASIGRAVIAIILTVAFATAALTQTAQKSTVSSNVSGPAVKPTTSAAYQDQGFAPGFDDLMTMLIQPRHLKLYYAGSKKNWELAAAEARDLRSSFGRIAQAIPAYEGNDVSLAMGNLIVPKIDALDAAIAAANSEKFGAAYKDLTVGCNECHVYMEHPFLVIKNPDDAVRADSDQEFSPDP